MPWQLIALAALLVAFAFALTLALRVRSMPRRMANRLADEVFIEQTLPAGAVREGDLVDLGDGWRTCTRVVDTADGRRVLMASGMRRTFEPHEEVPARARVN